MKSLGYAQVRAAALARARLGPGPGQARRASDAAGSELKKTPLYDVHVAHRARMVPFAGYSMPVQYEGMTHTDSHRFTRRHASLFDVSHMVQHVFRGPGAAAFLERVTPSSWASAVPMQSRLTAFLWPEGGGIVDDAMVTRIGEDEYHVVTNGACLDKDSDYFDDQLDGFGGGVDWARLDGSGLVALQGPEAARVLRAALATDVDLDGLYFGSAVWAKLKLADGAESHRVLISRGGYTGEDGFEMSFNAKLYPAQETTRRAVETLLAAAGPQTLRLAGLGPRDSLRLEAGMCLYGQDLDDTTTPAEAGLGWIIPPERRASGGFHGADVIVPQLTPKSKGGRGTERRRVGLVVQGPPAREGAKLELEGQSVGRVTSGLPSPSTGKSIAMGYVKTALHAVGTELEVVVRGRKQKAVVTRLPFVPARYHKASRT